TPSRCRHVCSCSRTARRSSCSGGSTSTARRAIARRFAGEGARGSGVRTYRDLEGSMNRGSTKQVERSGEAWIDAIESVLNAQKDFYINGLRWWQRLSLGAFATQAAAVEGTAD